MAPVLPFGVVNMVMNVARKVLVGLLFKKRDRATKRQRCSVQSKIVQCTKRSRRHERQCVKRSTCMQFI